MDPELPQRGVPEPRPEPGEKQRTRGRWGKPDRDGGGGGMGQRNMESKHVWGRGQVLGVWGAEREGSLLAPGDGPSPEVSTE